MASIRKESNGRKAIQVCCSDGKRRTIRLGKTHMRTAEKIKTHIEAIHAANSTGVAVEPEQSQWLASLDDTMHARIAAVGLCKPRLKSTLEAWIERYLASHSVKESTIANIRRTGDQLIQHFGGEKQLRDITPHNAKEWRSSIAESGNERNKDEAPKPLADATIRKRTSRAKQIFTAAIDAGLITSNPFEKLVSAPVGNPERQVFVPQADIEKVIKASDCESWRIIWAFARFGGMRSHETRLQRWDDIDIPNRRMVVRSEKSPASRVCPIFPELLPHLMRAREMSDSGAVYVQNRYKPFDNIGTTGKKLVERAGLVAWEKLFQNLRASRETELMEVYPAKDVSSWLGNSVPVAMKHYAMARELTFELAAQNGVVNKTQAVQLDDEGGAESGAVLDGTEQHERTKKPARRCK